MHHYLTGGELDALDAHEDLSARRAAGDVRQLSQDLLLAKIEEQGRVVLGNAHDPTLSFLLWRALDASPRLSETDAAELRRLADVAGGWWLITDQGLPVFLDTAEWIHHYQEYQGG